ncbi:heavy metal-associated isoprenylated plant protein 41-like [Bidens hawaiensis]|uniref:heavy metal-associated isoprenylated plant protein 41-like n=1 Tax=Bidens hawaiensis TaxID=980011 RepID=UPI00404A7B35
MALSSSSSLRSRSSKNKKNLLSSSNGMSTRKLKRILLAGDGDFSFSSSLAAAVKDGRNITATSLDTTESLFEKYKNIATDNIKKLRDTGATVIHGVDATTMNTNPQLQSLAFDLIIFNNPHAGFKHGDKSKRAIE